MVFKCAYKEMKVTLDKIPDKKQDGHNPGRGKLRKR